MWDIQTIDFLPRETVWSIALPFSPPKRRLKIQNKSLVKVPTEPILNFKKPKTPI